MFLIFVHAMLSLFMMVGLFGSYSNLGEPIGEWAVMDILTIIGLTGFTGIATIGVASFTSIISILSGISPFVSLSYGLVVGLFINTWLKLSGIITQVSGALGEYGFIINFVALLTGTVFAYLVIQTLISMSTPGFYQ